MTQEQRLMLCKGCDKLSERYKSWSHAERREVYKYFCVNNNHYAYLNQINSCGRWNEFKVALIRSKAND